MRVFHCDHCGQLLFFENINCVRCGRALAFIPELNDLVSLDLKPTSDGPNRWTSPLTNTTYKLCENYSKHNVCNWAIPYDDTHSLCRSCRLTRTIPNLSKAGNDRLWYLCETAKRRLIYTLDQLALFLKNRVDDPENGLAFDLLEDPEPGSKVMTGHANGIITVNIAEADDAERAKRRVELNEPYRTLLGHFRHESGHYYWDRFFKAAATAEANNQSTDATRARIASFRDLFGDERDDYQAAVKRHYAQGAPNGWQNSFVSAYATMHPWEDWAETWAHYLHMIDTLETAAACGMSITPPRKDEPTLEEVPNPVIDADIPFDHMMASWTPITYVLNNLNRGLGNPDAYPFVLSDSSIHKLRFVHDMISHQAE